MRPASVCHNSFCDSVPPLSQPLSLSQNPLGVKIDTGRSYLEDHMKSSSTRPPPIPQTSSGPSGSSNSSPDASACPNNSNSSSGLPGSSDKSGISGSRNSDELYNTLRYGSSACSALVSEESDPGAEGDSESDSAVSIHLGRAKKIKTPAELKSLVCRDLKSSKPRRRLIFRAGINENYLS